MYAVDASKKHAGSKSAPQDVPCWSQIITVSLNQDMSLTQDKGGYSGQDLSMFLLISSQSVLYCYVTCYACYYKMCHGLMAQTYDLSKYASLVSTNFTD
jgi:hypothetical protein